LCGSFNLFTAKETTQPFYLPLKNDTV
jgi:hypothetical protein